MFVRKKTDLMRRSFVITLKKIYQFKGNCMCVVIVLKKENQGSTKNQKKFDLKLY